MVAWLKKYPDATMYYGLSVVKRGKWQAYTEPGVEPSHWTHEDGWSIWDYSDLQGQRELPVEICIPQEPRRPFDYGKIKCRNLQEAMETIPLLRARLNLIRALDTRYFARIEALEKIAGHLVP